MAVVVGDYASGCVSFEHLDAAEELVVDRDEGAGSAALCGPVDDQPVGRQAGQCSTDRLEVIAAAAGLGDDLGQLRQAHFVVGDLRPLFAQHGEYGCQHQAPRAAKTHPRGV
jgi:hypothetical protein